MRNTTSVQRYKPYSLEIERLPARFALYKNLYVVQIDRQYQITVTDEQNEIIHCYQLKPRDQIIIGRSQSSDLTLPDRSARISRQHLEICLTSQEELQVTMLGSNQKSLIIEYLGQRSQDRQSQSLKTKQERFSELEVILQGIFERQQRLFGQNLKVANSYFLTKLQVILNKNAVGGYYGTYEVPKIVNQSINLYAQNLLSPWLDYEVTLNDYVSRQRANLERVATRDYGSHEITHIPRDLPSRQHSWLELEISVENSNPRKDSAYLAFVKDMLVFMNHTQNLREKVANCCIFEALEQEITETIEQQFATEVNALIQGYQAQEATVIEEKTQLLAQAWALGESLLNRFVETVIEAVNRHQQGLLEAQKK